MDFIKEALDLGFANAAVIDVKDLVFVPEYRQFCEENLCGNFDLVPSCPPVCGTPEEMYQKALNYKKALILQSVLESPEEQLDVKKAKHDLNILTEKLHKKISVAADGIPLIISAGPYKQFSCMSTYGIDAQKMAEAANMLCWAQDGKIRLFSLILFNPKNHRDDF